MRVLIIGCGYVGMALGEDLARAGHEVHGLRRSAGATPEMHRSGITLIRGDITNPDDLDELKPAYDWVVNVASSSRGGVDDYRAVYLQGTRNVLRWLNSHPPQRYIYTSSTSVYSQTDGAFVTEDSPAEPDSETSRILRQTEDLLLAQTSVPAIVLRTSGIYGPDRGHLFQQYLRGEATLRGVGSNLINMVHLLDVVGAIKHCFHQGKPGEIYNLTDDEPVTQTAFFSWLAQMLGKPLPRSAPPDPHRKRGLTSKRVSNAKLKSGTGYRFIFPTFREGYSDELRRLGLR